jgi:hypothetical protein
MGDIVFLTSVIVLLPAKHSPGQLHWVDMILSTETVGNRPVAILEDISVSVTIPMGILASQTTALLTRISAIS